MQVENNNMCFACGEKNPYGLKLKFDIDKEKHEASSKIVISNNYQSWKDIVHGGIVSLMLDEVAVYAVSSYDKACVTAELKVKFRKPVPTNKEITIKAKVIENKKNRIFIVKSTIELDNEILAEADVKMFVVKGEF